MAANVIDAVAAQATFPESNPFGLVTNGEANPMFIQITNAGENNFTLVSASASYHDTNKHWKLVKNATVTKFNLPVNAGANFTAPYNLNSELRSQEHGLTVWIDLKHGKELHRVTAFNSTVSIVEPATSWFDPQVIFMYLVVGATLIGAGYLAFTMYFEQPKKTRKGARKHAKAAPAVVEGSVSDSGKGAYDEDWIPAQHKRRVKGDAATSGGEATSGAESGPEKARRRRAKK
ncbi:uncharacterized protein CcaverHIS019_0407560 [Cutaneotrichosporon cavernicola]|uniref:Translocon-associated protein subunit alpha n=1 Tax=Cutaneotrichosporon cavernicola TaxID=279322 RepID=A0AA48QW34_9TREE|nr:uncharacterized protein CcaverHIS019_0407560 [Cutaneotrichosporon cavernicola]BEI91936.1 hypothetical protein CcaverHIS019_0407560 [Cutaneotrichosporon cavernicola]BEI99707.1 hypothetical protein CcaverHIS631_0407500 [Cutaneotrichosporon cavernicola]BEJ07482.1 hypothetical protein CcaverHIS641_0407510 [Cutaneotrichosporon cavernicola]